MLSETESVYELWEEKPPVFPPHSRLYHLDPIGVGTPFVESLTSYLTRLAEAHSVFPSTLVTYEILPLVNPPQLQQDGGSVYAQLSAFWRKSALLNGVVRGAENWVRALEHLTGQRDLRFLTLLPFSAVLPPRNLFRRKRAWCPLCYEQWREAGLIVYEPLLWTLECVTVCVHHHVPLYHCCPYPDCEKVLLPLGPRMSPGYCPTCHRWLGYFSSQVKPFQQLTDEEWQWQHWVEQTLGELLSFMPTLSVSPQREWIATTIATHLDVVMQGKTSELARRLNMHVRSIRDWLRGSQLPHLGNLLRICFLFELTPLSLLTGTALSRTLPQTYAQKSVPGERTYMQMRHFDTKRIQQALEEALQETPPPSMREVAQRLTYDPSHIQKHFPDLCQAISRRYQTHRAAQKEARIQRLGDELRLVMRKLHEQGQYPSWTQIRKMLTKPGITRDPAIKDIRREMLKELGWEHEVRSIDFY